MFKAFFADRKWMFWAYGGGLLLIGLLLVQVGLSVRLSDWRGEFYDMMQAAHAHTSTEFYRKLYGFVEIIAPWTVLGMITNYVTRLYALRWREAITFSYIPRWRNVKEEIEGASQRIQEDTARFARIVESLGKDAVNAIMKLIAFFPILWELSDKVIVEPLKGVPGSMVWVALATSIGGMVISWYVGAKLPGLEYNNQKGEGLFRKELVYGEDDKERYELVPTLVRLFTGVRLNYERLYFHYGYFDLWSNMYFQAIWLVPYILMGPSLFSGTITLGVVSRTAYAFDDVHGSFAFLINNWTTITELRSIHLRLSEFEKNLDRFE